MSYGKETTNKKICDDVKYNKTNNDYYLIFGSKNKHDDIIDENIEDISNNSDDLINESNDIDIVYFESTFNESLLRKHLKILIGMMSFNMILCIYCNQESYKTFGKICHRCIDYDSYRLVYIDIDREVSLYIRGYANKNIKKYMEICKEYYYNYDGVIDYTHKLICMIKQHILEIYLFSPSDTDLVKDNSTLYYILCFDILSFVPAYLADFIENCKLSFHFWYKLIDDPYVSVLIHLVIFYNDDILTVTPIFILSRINTKILTLPYITTNNYILLPVAQYTSRSEFNSLIEYVCFDIAHKICDYSVINDDAFIIYQNSLKRYMDTYNKVHKNVSLKIYEKSLIINEYIKYELKGFNDIWFIEYFKYFGMNENNYFNIFITVSDYISKYFSLNINKCIICNKIITAHIYGRCVKCYINNKLEINTQIKKGYLDIYTLIINRPKRKRYNLVIRSIITKIKSICVNNLDIISYMMRFYINKHIRILKNIDNCILGDNNFKSMNILYYSWNDIFSLLILEGNYFKHNNIIVMREKRISYELKYYDFLCKTCDIVFAIEIDDVSHNKIIKHHNDIDKDKIAQNLNIAVIRVDISEFYNKSPSYNILSQKYNSMCKQIDNLMNK